ncbi:MAG: sugar phosphate nucleotidyltransferase [Acutalibacteraceae bacterium]
MKLTRTEFNLLTKADRLGNTASDAFSEEELRTAKRLQDAGFLCGSTVTESGYALLEPYRVKRAVFFAAGFGVRMVPVTYDRPKPLVEVNGKRIIDTLLDAVVAAGIREIYIVRGYKGEMFDCLLEKYPFIRFVENTGYDKANNILSAYLVRDKLKNAYVFESDIYLENPALLPKYQFESNYLGVPTDKTDDWCFTANDDLRITSLKRGGTNCYHMYGISYMDETVGQALEKDMQEIYETVPESHDRFWDDVALYYNVERYDIKVRPCTFDDVTEIDTLDELIEIDPSYSKYKE